MNQFGCDSLVLTQTSLLPSDTILIQATTCDAGQVGTVEELLSNQFGCDSLVLTQTSLLPSDTILIQATTCDAGQVGTVEELLTNQFGCDSLVLTQTSLLPSDTILIQATTCDAGQVGTVEELLTNQFGCDSLVLTQTSLLPSDTILIQATTCDAGQVGTVEELLSNQFGCDSLVVTQTSLLPSDTILIQATTCDVGQVGTVEELLTNQFGCDSLVVTQTSLLPSDTTYLVEFTCNPLDTGLVETLLMNTAGCDSLIQIQTNLSPSNECSLDFFVVGDTISCDGQNGVLTIDLQNGSAPFTYTWSELSGSFGTGLFFSAGIQMIQDLPAGNYMVTIEDASGLMESVNVLISAIDPVDFGIEILSDNNGYQVSCPSSTNGIVQVVNISGGVGDYDILWSNGLQSAQASGLTAGWWSVTVSDSGDCSQVDSIFLAAPPPIEFELVAIEPACVGNLGSIRIENLYGGVQPFTFNLNGTITEDMLVFEDLSPGNYFLEVVDANGCVIGLSTTIPEPTNPTVDLGPDLEVNSGEVFQLNATTDILPDNIGQVMWSLPVDCENCLSIQSSLGVSTLAEVLVIDIFGCEAVDSLFINVLPNRSVFIPNAISSDNNGINDQFTIYTGDDFVQVRSMQIFSRWGEVVFESRDLVPNEPAAGWDGTHRGEPVSPGVYVYLFELEWADGQKEWISGDVLLIR